MTLEFTLSYEGNHASEGVIDFYDASHALAGFQRSLALTVHLILNGEVITQAPSLRGAQILLLPAQSGSWKVVATILGTLFALGQAQQNSVLGHLATSAYDYIVSETLGFHIDFTKTLGQSYEQARRVKLDVKPQTQQKFDAVIEKCEFSIKEIHRPIVWSKTAELANLYSNPDGVTRPLTPTLDYSTYEYIDVTREDFPIKFVGRVSSYNINTYKGRIFVPDEGRPIPFQLAESARNARVVSLITASLASNAASRFEPGAEIVCTGFRNVSKSGRLKAYRIVDVNAVD